MLQFQPANPMAGDAYAFGVILWELMTWDVPWAGVAVDQIMQLKRNGGHLDISSSPNSLAALPGAKSDKAAFQRVAVRYIDLIKQVWTARGVVHNAVQPPLQAACGASATCATAAATCILGSAAGLTWSIRLPVAICAVLGAQPFQPPQFYKHLPAEVSLWGTGDRWAWACVTRRCAIRLALTAWLYRPATAAGRYRRRFERCHRTLLGSASRAAHAALLRGHNT